jgi:molecular chaperone DnaK
MPLLGIDLGTTNTVATVNHGVGTTTHGKCVSLPSVVAFLPNDVVRVGRVARRRRAIDTTNTIFSSKRIIGRAFEDSNTVDFRDRYPFDIVEASCGSPAFRTRAGDFTPTEIATRVIQQLLEDAGVTPDECEVVITVPAGCRSAQLQATRDAASAAGLPDVRLIDEPSATAFAYIHADHPRGRGLVYDLGGGTFDCAILDFDEGQPRVLGHLSDLQLGGDDIDDVLARWVAQHVLEKYNWDLANYAETYNRLLARCEDAKISLSTSETAPVYLSQIDPECPAHDDTVLLHRGLIEELCQDLVHRSLMACNEVLKQTGLRVSDVETVFLAGGTTQLPLIQRGIEAFFGRPGLHTFDPTEVVSIGASLASS